MSGREIRRLTVSVALTVFSTASSRGLTLAGIDFIVERAAALVARAASDQTLKLVDELMEDAGRVDAIETRFAQEWEARRALAENQRRADEQREAVDLANMVRSQVQAKIG